METFPVKAVDVQQQFEYTVCEKGYKNVSLILHVMAPMSFYDFKTPVYQWLQLNKYQDQINELLDAIADKKHVKDPTFYEMHQTTSKFAKYH
eukprot:784692-Ditylum_brightwellii.AAC.1